jgi:dTDP-4-amino-4,6-dideoxygalactose transaminase
MGVSSDIHYPIPDHKQTAIAEQYKHLVLKNTEILAREVLTLPCYPELDQESIQIVVNAVNSWAP